MSYSEKIENVDFKPLYDLLISHKPDKDKATGCGRKISLCNCISLKTFFLIAAIVGAILLVLGTLALVGYFAPASGGAAALAQIKAAATFAASKLSSDLFTLAMFTTSIGGALTVTGVVGFCGRKI